MSRQIYQNWLDNEYTFLNKIQLKCTMYIIKQNIEYENNVSSYFNFFMYPVLMIKNNIFSMILFNKSIITSNYCYVFYLEYMQLWSQGFKYDIHNINQGSLYTMYMISKGPPYIFQACSSKLSKNRSLGVISLLNFICQKSDQHVMFLYGIIVHI